METNTPKKRGAQLGNRNAVKHGRYCGAKGVHFKADAELIRLVRATLKAIKREAEDVS